MYLVRLNANMICCSLEECLASGTNVMDPEIVDSELEQSSSERER